MKTTMMVAIERRFVNNVTSFENIKVAKMRRKNEELPHWVWTVLFMLVIFGLPAFINVLANAH